MFSITSNTPWSRVCLFIADFMNKKNSHFNGVFFLFPKALCTDSIQEYGHKGLILLPPIPFRPSPISNSYPCPSEQSCKGYYSLWNGTTLKDPHTSSVEVTSGHFQQGFFCCDDSSLPVLLRCLLQFSEEKAWRLVIRSQCQWSHQIKKNAAFLLTANVGELCSYLASLHWY